MAEDAPLFSVVTIVFNDREGLLRTCSSVQAQLGQPELQHVVIDGGSTDGSEQLLRCYKPDVFVSESDRGIYDAMNKGLEHSSGSFVIFLNSGDTFADCETLRELSKVVRETSARWGYGRARVVDSDGRNVRAPIGLVPYSHFWHRFGLSTICHQAVWMEKALLTDLGGFSEEFGLAGDYHLLVKAGQRSAPRDSWRIDVDFLAGGASDRGVYKRLKYRSTARAMALQYSSAATHLDLAWTYGQIAYVWSRKRARSLLRFAGLEPHIGGGRRLEP